MQVLFFAQWQPLGVNIHVLNLGHLVEPGSCHGNNSLVEHSVTKHKLCIIKWQSYELLLVE